MYSVKYLFLPFHMKKILYILALICFISGASSTALAVTTPPRCTPDQTNLAQNACGLYDKGIDAFNDGKLEQAETYLK